MITGMAPTSLPPCQLCKNASFKLAVDSWKAFKNTLLQRSASQQHAAAITVAPHGMTRCSFHAAQRGLLAVWILLLSLARLAAAQSAAGANGATVLFSSTFQSRRVAGSGPPQCHAPAPCILGSVHRHSAVSHAHPDLT